LAADFGPVNNFDKRGFIGNLSFKMGIPQRTGIMEDRDWENENPSTLTSCSRHDNFTEREIMADLSFGYSFPLLNFIAMGINLDFSFMHFFWIAKDGYYQKLLSDQTWTDKIPMEGKQIEYSQNWFILSPGVFIKLRLGRFFSLNGNFNYSPLIYCADRDEHLLRGITFLDYLYYGHYLKGGGGITFSPMNNLDLNLFLFYSSIIDSRGDSYMNSVKNIGIAGGGYTAFEIGLSARLRLFGRK
jgi:outer membrane protease